MNGTPPVLAAPVQGFAAFVLDKALARELPARLSALEAQAAAGRVHPQRVAEVRATWAAIRTAAEQWATWNSAAHGSTAEPPAAPPRGSREIGTDRAAVLLQVTPNRIRQLIRGGRLPARKVSGTWVVDRHDVDLYREVPQP